MPKCSASLMATARDRMPRELPSGPTTFTVWAVISRFLRKKAEVCANKVQPACAIQYLEQVLPVTLLLPMCFAREAQVNGRTFRGSRLYDAESGPRSVEGTNLAGIPSACGINYPSSTSGHQLRNSPPRDWFPSMHSAARLCSSWLRADWVCPRSRAIFPRTHCGDSWAGKPTMPPGQGALFGTLFSHRLCSWWGSRYPFLWRIAAREGSRSI